MSPRQVFILATGADTAGTAVRLAWAFKHVPQVAGDWEARSMVSAINYIEYPQDLTYSLPSLRDHYDAADVVQLNSTTHGHDWYDRGQGKPTVIMHHGLHFDHFDRDIYGCVAEAERIGAVQVGSTVNLELLAPFGPPSPQSVTWLPTPYPLESLAKMRRALYSPIEVTIKGKTQRLIRVAHAPTDRAVKSTEAFISAMKSLKERGFPVEMVLIERQTHSKTMMMKAKYADILVDQLNLGYGCNAIEAWGLGIPVIGAVNAFPAWREHMIARFGLKESQTGLPFLETDEIGLETAIESLITSELARAEWAAIGLAHVWRHHSEQSVVALAREIYEVAVELPTSTALAPVRGMPGASRAQKLGEMRRIRAEKEV